MSDAPRFASGIAIRRAAPADAAIVADVYRDVWLP